LDFQRGSNRVELKDDVVRIFRQHHELPGHRLIAGRGDFDGVPTFIERQGGLTIAFDTVTPDA
jgi:hypothetical protein